MKAGKRVHTPKYVFDPEMPPELNLAAAIVHRAFSDVKLLKGGRTPTNEDCFKYNEHELRQFFKSRWCSMLMCVSDISAETLLKEVGL